DVIIPSSVMYVYEYAFVDCDNLGVVALARTAEQGITLIHPTAFEDNGLICFVVFDFDSFNAYSTYFASYEDCGLEDYLQYVMYFA
ncbi:MAG: hypothetical protein IKC35_04165, partial [Clostridia bacterium]|nr:hypothetical protein [Clostridia bacterium]